MIALVQNELMKIFSRKSSWMYMIFIVLFILIGAIFYTKMYGGDEHKNWRTSIQADIKTNQEVLKKKPNDQYAQQSIKKDQDYLKYNINPNAHTNWNFMNDVVITLGMFVTLFSVIVCSGNVAAEFANGTIKQLIIRPHPRWKILLSKYIAVTIYSIILLVILAIMGFIIGSIFLGYSDFHTKIIESAVNTNGYDIKDAGSQFLLKLGLYLPSLIIVTAISFMLSTLFRTQALAVGIGIFVLFMMNTLGGVILLLMNKYHWMKFLIFPHLDLSVYAYQDHLVDGVNFAFSIVTLIIYYLVFMAITFAYFQKRDIAN
ncbi:ABC transporter permease [Heyndrickxia ginsengihumi]|uniref:ABC transporter permease subunit n=1 Tax=Heyndrickxia ginsengihumi TaxID=363870 RepID=A0A0A6V9M9_9BACI|nr:ABC transporter permease subunit [Heyndrickxia ginsengihumi]KHD84258.1 hypothetical protein NG54_16670 [Heyndrickxia ginsengihumi]MBE6184200.1 hypothetical protein [Bacillus sp. (in: firmicutes)]NEY20289.1 ABC transporter permease subunit [Heyndrickxia ginsengihumi]